MPAKKTNPDFVNGIPELLVLRVLSDGPRHGYSIVQAINSRTNQALEFGEGSIYPVLHKLEKQGLLLSRREAVRGRTRIVYRLSKRGTTQLEQSATRWQNVVAAVQTLLNGAEDGDSALATDAS